ncbi:unnamed protein product [Chironomus riparius]|uniref:Uncharacterized protein n=1 Tax=Chironomus riparius TaxID=315576 RepID=A0A9N9S2X3_9DIPT|nr:unnamed protein product [Chironomus riparius]
MFLMLPPKSCHVRLKVRVRQAVACWKKIAVPLSRNIKTIKFSQLCVIEN